MKTARPLASARICYQIFIAALLLASLESRAALPVEMSGDSTDALYAKEEDGKILLGNSLVEFAFSVAEGGKLVGMADKARPTESFGFSGEGIQGEWSIDREAAPSIALSAESYEAGECDIGADAVTLKLQNFTEAGRVTHSYTLRKGSRYLIAKCSLENTSSSPHLLANFHFVLRNLAIGGDLRDNEYIYPPTWQHFMKGAIAEATSSAMNARYIYGWSQPTDKMMLPYAMIFNRTSGSTVALAAVNPRAKVYVGALGGESGSLAGRFETWRTLPPGGSLDSGTIYLSLLDGGWQEAMREEKIILMAEAGFQAPKQVPDFVKDLVIVWHGIPGMGVNTYDDLGKELRILKDAGANAMIVGGKVWFCPASNHGDGTIFDYIPIPQNGFVEPASDVGGVDGFRKLVNEAHALDMKLFTWGPVSMAGISREAAEAKSEPDWWIYKPDGQFNDWYHFMAPANPHAPGWRRFVVKNVEKILTDYGVDGFWLDSSWQDHQLNFKAADGWVGGPNGDKLSLIDEIVETAKRANPEAVVMGEVSGAEFMSRLDITYLQVHGIWPILPPEDIQSLVIAQEINRLPGVRPFGQIELGQGFYPELADQPSRDLAEAYSDSWIAKTFLVSTLDRIPVYFGLSWAIDALTKSSLPSEGDTPDLIAARKERAKLQKWFNAFRQVNKVRTENPEVRTGDTVFGCIEASPAAIVHYLRKNDTTAAIVLLNAEKTAQAVQVKILRPDILNIHPGKTYLLKNLMTEKAVGEGETTLRTGEDLLATGFDLSLEGYEGAVIKLIEATP